MQSIDKVFVEVCGVCAQLASGKGAVPTNSPYARLARRLLERFAAEVMAKLSDVSWDHLQISVSRGQAVLPKILWVAITEKHSRVSQTTSIAVCFGRHGEGAVAGLIDTAPVSERPGFQRIHRTRLGGMRVDVDGTKPATSYNDKFANPKEFLVQTFDGDELIAHLRGSFRLPWAPSASNSQEKRKVGSH